MNAGNKNDNLSAGGREASGAMANEFAAGAGDEALELCDLCEEPAEGGCLDAAGNRRLCLECLEGRDEDRPWLFNREPLI
jgi:hypothetical protein